MKENQLNLPKDFILSLHLALYTSKKQNITITKLCKLIPDRFEYKNMT